MLGFLWWACLLFSVHAQWVIDDDGCRTPDKKTGNCIRIVNCQPMKEVLSKLESPSPSIVKKIRAYQCGVEQGQVKVCCPQEPIVFAERLENTNHPKLRKLLPETCGHLKSVDPRIVNGNNSALNEFPWMALLRYRRHRDNSLRFDCGGSIINKNYILTAAHCITGLVDRTLAGVRVGEHSIKNETDCERQSNKKILCNPPVQDLDIEEVVPHPQYAGKEGKFRHDIGLIRVSTINLDVESARPVCLPVGVLKDQSFQKGVVTGWGVTDIWTRATADILQKVLLPVVDKALCNEKYQANDIPLADTQICLGGVNRDSCGGDSGGPMVVPTAVETNIVYVQQGIVSFGPQLCANPDLPGIYTQVKSYMDWILDSMKE